MTNPQTRPQDITIDRSAGLMRILWLDGHSSEFPLRWLRANCPCATCREERRAAAMAVADPLRLTATPPPNTEVAGAEFVGQYAIRLTWSDGHATGIFPFAALRTACPCPTCNPEGAPPLVMD
ncbi:MAG: DUF971 domain-containing protein [Caldilinea sp.]|nr:DUF971 domain-containing protein [Caldilinea sp.]MDW8441313.1 DUF971 domain-containing protein [Caldilineaceae bacterium]